MFLGWLARVLAHPLQLKNKPPSWWDFKGGLWLLLTNVMIFFFFCFVGSQQLWGGLVSLWEGDAPRSARL